MLGIVAVVGSKIDESLMDFTVCSTNHEKLRQTDLYFESPLAIGKVHSGTINAEPQAIFNEDKSICIVMDGEGLDQVAAKVTFS